jgi:hypothetical protein
VYAFFQALRTIHIGFGTVALVAFWIPVIAPKGGKVHVRVGWGYAVCMSVVVLTAYAMSFLAFTHPVEIRHFDHPLTANEIEFVKIRSHQLAIFLTFLGSVTLAAGVQGIGVLRTRQLAQGPRNPLTLALNAFVVLAGITVLTIGVTNHSWTFKAMSLVGLVGVGNLSYLLYPPKEKMRWWYQHVSSMIATAIAGYTAFLVFGGARMMPQLARSQWYALVWIAPTIIGGTAITLTIAYYKKKFHEGGKARKTAAA